MVILTILNLSTQMSDKTKFYVILTGTILLLAFIFMIKSYLHNPFRYPYLDFECDITGKRNPDADDVIDEFLIQNGIIAFEMHEKRIQNWKLGCEERIRFSIFKNHRRRQYINVLDDDSCYAFFFIRKKTRYKQINYEKLPYTVKIKEQTVYCSMNYIMDRYEKLNAIDFACTLNQYNSKNQRKLATRKLREQIMLRDNYTCQKCGKYMPDEVGLQIDHIIPVSKGGKSVPANMQVLCSKCNGRKSNKSEVIA